jgi:excisionase family DNA binding protein
MQHQTQPPNQKFAYSVEEAAELLSIKRDSLFELIRSNKLGSFKVGTRRLVAHRHLEAFIESEMTS